MADKQKSNGKKSTPVVKPGTPEMAALLAAGYPDMTPEKAEAIIKERKANPQLWPYEIYERANAYLAAYTGQSVVISEKPAWRRDFS